MLLLRVITQSNPNTDMMHLFLKFISLLLCHDHTTMNPPGNQRKKNAPDDV